MIALFSEKNNNDAPSIISNRVILKARINDRSLLILKITRVLYDKDSNVGIFASPVAIRKSPIIHVKYLCISDCDTNQSSSKKIILTTALCSKNIYFYLLKFHPTIYPVFKTHQKILIILCF